MTTLILTIEIILLCLLVFAFYYGWKLHKAIQQLRKEGSQIGSAVQEFSYASDVAKQSYQELNENLTKNKKELQDTILEAEEKKNNLVNLLSNIPDRPAKKYATGTAATFNDNASERNTRRENLLKTLQNLG